MQNPRNLKVWQKSHSLSLEVFRATREIPARECFSLIQQLQSSALSVESNITEGATRGGDVEFRRFARIALSSAFELDSQLLVARNLDYLSPAEYARMRLLDEEIRKMLWALIRRLEGDRR